MMKKRDIIGISLIIILFIIGYYVFSQLGIDKIQVIIEKLGLLAPIGFILLMLLAVVISPIPSMPLAIMAGSIWGGFLGGTYSVIGAMFGAITAFYISRKFGMGFLEKYFPKSVGFCEWCKRVKNQNITWFIFIARLLPVFQFDIISYGAGLTNIKPWKFSLATLFGMMPITYLLAYTGKSLISLNPLITISITIVLVFMMYKLTKRKYTK